MPQSAEQRRFRSTATTVIVTGAGGRLGRLLQQAWPAVAPDLHPVWLVRQPPAPGQVAWDMALPPPPDLPRHAVILHLAGSVRGPAESHPALAQAVLALARASDARHLFLASSAAVYGRAAAAHDEAGPVAPLSDYGRAKLAAEAVLAGQPGATCLRIGNVAGADAILGNPQARRLDPVPDDPRGPLRSYIGPLTLARVLAELARQAAQGRPLPAVLNIAQAPAVAMADLLQAAGRDWRWGPPNPDVIPRAILSTDRLAALVPDLPAASASALVAERSLLADWTG